MGLFDSPVMGFLMNIATGQMGTNILRQNRPQYTNPVQGLGIDLNRPIGMATPSGTPEVTRATGGQMRGTPQAVAQQTARDREAAFGRAQEAEAESRQAAGTFRRGLTQSVGGLRQGMGDIESQMLAGQQYFQQAREAAQQLPGIIAGTIGGALQAIRSLTGDVRTMAQSAKEDLGDFVVGKMEGLRAGIDAQFQTIERQALDGLYAQGGGVSTAERQALQRSLQLEKGRMVSQAYQPVLAAETERLAQANIQLTDIVSRMMGLEAQMTAGLAQMGTDANIKAAQLQETLADHQTAMEQGYKIAKWNLGTFAEQLAVQGNEVAFNLVQQIPRPYLMMADVNNYLLGQYYGLVETANMLEQAGFGDVQTIFSPLLSGMQTGINTVQSRAAAKEAAEAGQPGFDWGSLVGGGLEGTGSLLGSAASDAVGAFMLPLAGI